MDETILHESVAQYMQFVCIRSFCDAVDGKVHFLRSGSSTRAKTVFWDYVWWFCVVFFAFLPFLSRHGAYHVTP